MIFLINTNYGRFSSLVNKWSWIKLCLLLTVSMILSCAEGIMLNSSNCADPYASIRISNIITSILVFIVLFKKGEIERINKLNPRKNVFSIYLVHNILILLLCILYNKHFAALDIHPGILGYLALETCCFALVLGFSYLYANRKVTPQASATNGIWLSLQFTFQEFYPFIRVRIALKTFPNSD